MRQKPKLRLRGGETVELEEWQWRSIIKQLRNSEDWRKEWDVTWAEGRIAELDFLQAVNGNSFEVKHDDIGCTSGFMAVEYECNGQPSGALATTAQHWAHRFIDTNNWMVVEVPWLRYLVERCISNERQLTAGGDGSRARFVRLPVSWALGQKGMPEWLTKP
jgi:hypothetical protein